MKQEEKLEYVNYILKDKNASYKGPNSLFKYRKFDEYTFDMLDNDYLFLCVANKLDDKSECTALLDVDGLFDKEKENITSLCLSKIIDRIKPITSEETFKQIEVVINSTRDKDGSVGAATLQALQSEAKKMNPDFNLTPMFDELWKMTDKFNNPVVGDKIVSLINLARNARQTIGICSLSADSNNDDAWRRYGANGSGYCVEYDMEGFESANIVFPVIYENKREKDIVLSFIAMLMSWVIIGISNGQIQQDVSQFLKLFITKSKKWQRQNEWRILGDKNSRIQAPRIKRVIVGKNATEENRLKIVECCKRNNIPLEDQD